MINFGMPTLIELGGLEKQVALCKKLNLSFIELGMDLPDYALDRLDPVLLKRITKETGIGFTLHLPEQMDLGVFDKTIRQNNIDYCVKAIRLAKKAGISLVNLHLRKGTHFTLPQGKVNLYAKYEKQYLPKIEEAYRVLSETGKKNKVNIHIENGAVFQFPFIARTVDRLMKSDNIYLTWDTGHDALTDFQERKVLMRYKPRIKHIHLHDFDGKSDHQALYTGTLDIDKVLRFAEKQKASVVIETKTVKALQDSVNNLKEKYLNSLTVKRC